MKPTVTYPDAERAMVDLLDELIAAHEPAATVSVGVPEGWQPTSPPHLQVAFDGSPDGDHPFADRPTIRIVARASTTTEAKRLAHLARGLLLAHRGGGGFARIRPGIGVLPARDVDTHAELASFTVLTTVRSIPIVEPTGS